MPGRSAEVLTQADVVEVEGKSFLQLDWACNWTVSFSTDDHCQVSVDAYSTAGNKLSPQGIDSLELVGQLARGAFDTGNHRFVRYNATSSGLTEIGKVEYAAATGTNMSLCATEIKLENKSPAGSNTSVSVSEIEKAGSCAMPPDNPHSRGPGSPTDTILAPGESAMLRLALNCSWDIDFVSLNRNCAASVELKEADGTLINTASDDLTVVGSGDVTLTKSAAGLTFEDDSSTAKVVDSLEFNGCLAATDEASTPSGKAKVSVVNTTPLYGIGFKFEKVTSACESAAMADIPLNPNEVGPANAVVSVEKTMDVVTAVTYTQYLDYRCNWMLEVSHPGGCSVAFSVEDADEMELVATATTQLLTKNKAMKHFQVGSDDNKVIATFKATVDGADASCAAGLPVRMVNVSMPLGYHFSRTGPDAEWNFLPGLRPSPGMASTNRDNVVEFDRQFPQVTLDILPHTAGAACTPAAGYVPDLTNDVVLPAGQVDDDAAKLNFTNGSQSLALARNCDWRIGFLSGIGVDVEFLTGQPDLVCYASAQVRDRDGMALGGPIAGAPDLGGYVDLNSGTQGLTYPAADGTATLVGSIDFEGCVPLEHPGSSEVMLYDDSGVAGDFTYTLTPAQRPKPQTAAQREAGDALEYETTCEGFEPPAAQSQADGLVFSGAPGARLHHLNNACDWVVEFTGASECEAGMLWQFGETGLRFVDAVWGEPAAPGSPGSAKVTLRLTQYHGDQLDHTQLGRGPPSLPADDPATDKVDERKLAQEDRNTAAALESGFGFFVGSGNELTEGGVRHTNEVRPAVLPAGVGAASISDLEGAQPVNAVSLECVSALDLSSSSGLQSPGLEIVAASPAEAAPDPSMDQVITPGGCVTHELRPSVTTQETLALPLLRGCDWTITFKSSEPTCRAAAEVLGANKTTLLQRVFQTSATAAEIELTKDAGGLQFTPSGAGATASVVGEIKFYDCFHPGVSLRVPTALAGERITVSFTAPASPAGCTRLASQVMEFGTANQGAPVAGLRSAPAALANLATDGTRCQYEVTATSANSLRGRLSAASQVSAIASSVVIEEFAEVELTLRNATMSASSHSDATQRIVLVTIAPKSQECSAPAPEGSPFSLDAAGSVTASRVVQLRAVNCVWTVSYRNTADDCTVEARFKDANDALVSGTTVDDDGSLEITTRSRAADSTPVAVLEFMVGMCQVVDTTRPAVTSVSVSPATVSVNGTATVSIVLSEVPKAGTFDADDVSVSPANLVTKGTLSGSGTSYTLPLTAVAAGSVSITVPENRFTDAADNQNTAAATPATLTISAAPDTTRPAVTSITVSPATVSIGSTATVAITLSEVPKAGTFDADDVSVTPANLVTKGALSGSGTSYTLPLTAVAAGSVSITVPANRFTDAADNQNTAAATPATLTISAAPDTTRPAVTSITVNPTSVNVNSTATVSIVLSEVPKAGTFDADDVSVSPANLVTKGTLSGSGTSYTLPLTAVASGSVSITVPENRFTDAADNQNTAAATPATLTISAAPDTTRPAVTSITVSPATVSVNGTATVTIELSEVPKAGTFDADDISLSPANLVTKGTLSGSGNSYTLPLTAVAAGSVSITVPANRFTDVADNQNTAAATPATLTISAAPDTTRPAVTSITVSPTTVSVGSTTTVSVVLSEVPKAGTFDADDISLSPANLVTKGTLSGSGTSYTLPLTGVAAGSVSITVPANRFTDAADNQNTAAATPATLTVSAAPDTTRPAVTSVSVSPTTVSVGSTVTVSIVLSEVPKAGTFDASDITVTPAGLVTKGLLSGSGTSYSLPLTAVAAGSVSITVPANRFTDVADNQNTAAATPATLTISATPTTTPPPVSVPPPTPGVSVSSASPVTEGETLRFGVSLPDRAAQEVTVSYTTSLGGSGSVPITAGQFSAVIEVPTQDNELDEADQTVRVTLTGATGGAAVASVGRTATGIVRDDDPSPLVGLGSVVIDGNRLRFKAVLSVKSGRDVRASYTSPAGSGNVVISAGQLDTQASQVFDRALLAAGGSLRLRLTSAQNASIDPNARERVVRPGGSWQFHQVSRDGGVRASKLAQALELGDSWRLFSWNATGQRWVEHSSASNPNTTLPAGTTITYLGPEADSATLQAAGLGRPESITLEQGWNIFAPDPAAVGLTADDFTRTRDGESVVIFDPQLVDCENLAGLLVIYTYDQNDPRSKNGFRLALPCHPEVQAQLGIPAIETIDQSDTIYAWFNSTTPTKITFTNGQYTPTG